ncbi:hypothetical protein FH972_024003 [Carpinus fangiana]|uniref:Uncharacterized protein n=1 Tax=Carpinus fangiana TaxID=176857 RepID=A0A5N6KWT1_9ROSI|nr:hypothetical protein FH972_024003 [Carpinus fangiana]
MLTESFIAASSAPPKLASSNSATLKDAGIFFHTLQPQAGLKTSFKKSSAAANCLAVSPTHIFTAQEGKAIVHVYNREKASQEAIASFSERITSIALIDESYLAIGLENGSISIWDTLCGRTITTAPLHLQPVTLVAADSSATFLLTASSDSTVLVWTLADILRLSTSSLQDQHHVEPLNTLTSHRAGITALAIGHSGSGFNVAVSGSKDRTAILWNYATGEQLQTYLLHDAPLALEFDPADRAIFASYADGSVQCINILNDSRSTAPIQPKRSTIWPYPSDSTASPATALSVSYDGTQLLTGHASGKICSWSIADHRLSAEVADYPGAPITNLSFLPPTGFPVCLPKTCVPEQVIKPRVHEPFSGTAGRTTLTWAYTMHAKLNQLQHCAPSRRPRMPRLASRITARDSPFARALHATGFPHDVLAAASEDLANTSLSISAVSSSTAAAAPADDFVALDQAPPRRPPHFTDVNEAMMEELFKLQRERREWMQERAVYRRRRDRKWARRMERMDEDWAKTSGGHIKGLPHNAATEWAERNGQKVERWDEGSELSEDTDLGDEKIRPEDFVGDLDG